MKVLGVCDCEEDRMDDAAIYRVSRTRAEIAICYPALFSLHPSIFTLLFTGSQWIATGLRPRDDKSGILTMKGMKKIGYISCHCEERTK